MLRSFFAKEPGQGLVEYSLILALIAIVAVGAISVFGGTVKDNLYGEIYEHIFRILNPGETPDPIQ
jgi:pilus assembly protein Flp/PilA